jgi:hypothetical protein
MNPHIFYHIPNEHITEVVRSIGLFLGIVLVAMVVGFVCLSVA